MTTLPPFLTLWILVEFAGSSDEDILMIKVRTKREKRPKTWSLRFDLLTITLCTSDNKPWRLVLRCWYLTLVHHQVVCGDDREIFVTIIEGSLEFDLILLKLWNKFALSQASNRIAVVLPERQSARERKSICPKNKQWIKLQRLTNGYRYLSTALSKQLLIQPLEYLPLELLQSKEESFFYVIDTSRPNIWGKRSAVMSVE